MYTEDGSKVYRCACRLNQVAHSVAQRPKVIDHSTIMRAQRNIDSNTLLFYVFFKGSHSILNTMPLSLFGNRSAGSWRESLQP